MNFTHLTQFVQFIQLAIVNLVPELLVFVCDENTVGLLNEVQDHLKPTIPVFQVFMESILDYEEQQNYCPMCPKTRLTIMALPEDRLHWGVHFIIFEYYFSNYIVLLWPDELLLSQKQMLMQYYKDFNIVVVELVFSGINVLAWNGNAADVKSNYSVDITEFHGPSEIFISNDTNALIFRWTPDYYPSGAKSISFAYRSLMGPYQYHVQMKDTNETRLVSAVVHLCRVIADHLDFSLQPRLHRQTRCSKCYQPYEVTIDSSLIPFYSYETEFHKLYMNKLMNTINIHF